MGSEMCIRDSRGGAGKLTEPLDSAFEGSLVSDSNGANEVFFVRGRLQLTPGKLGAATGRLTGTDSEGNSFESEVSGAGTDLGRDVFGSPDRAISLSLTTPIQIKGRAATRIEGNVERPFIDWFQAPRDDFETNRLHATLSHKYDIAVVLTWIAGLLNMMVLWDAFEGPAYGYGDEKPEEDDPEADAPKGGKA